MEKLECTPAQLKTVQEKYQAVEYYKSQVKLQIPQGDKDLYNQ